MKLGLRESVVVLLLLAVPVASWWFVFRPRTARRLEMREQIRVKQEKLRALNRMTGTLGDLQKEIASLQGALRFFQSKLPGEKEIDKVLQEIWQMAESNRMVTKSIRTLDRTDRRGFTAPTGPHAEQPITVQLEGDFMGFYAFLQALEKQPRIVRIQDMTLLRPAKSPGGHIRATFIMSIFFEKNKEGRS